MEDTKTRERAFHDARYGQAQDPRDALAKYYSVTAASSEHFRRLIEEASHPGMRLLEYGCGTGGDWRFYQRLGCTVYGIDISQEAIVKAREKALQHGLDAHYSVQDAERTDFPDGTFDVVTGSGILHHLDLDRSLTELARITTPEGSCIFIEPLGHNPLINLYRRLTPALRTADEHPLRQPDFELMRRHFHEVDLHHYCLSSLAAVGLRRTPWFDPAYRRLLALDRWLFRRFGALGRHAWICIVALRRPKRALA